MPKPKDKDLDPNQGSPTEPNEPQEPSEPTEPTEPQEPEEGEGFTKKQLQQLGSLVGKITSTQISEKVMPLLNREPDKPAIDVTPIEGTQPGEEALRKFNEEVTREFFAGNPMKAFQMMQAVHSRAQQNLSEANKRQTDTAINSYRERPYFKDVYENVKNKAYELVREGAYTPEAATRVAYAEAVYEHIQQSNQPPGEEGSLDMIDSGRPSDRKRTPQLPPHLKEAMARDIEEGLFKDEKEWIAALNPKTKEAYGID